VLVSQRLTVTRSLLFIFSSAATFESPGFQSLETYEAMNWRKFVFLGCMVACIFAVSIAKAQMKGHGNTPRSIARMPMHRAPMPGSMVRVPMRRVPTMNSALDLRRFNRFNYKDFNQANRFRRFKHFNKIIFIGNFASPWWRGPWWGRNWAYPYGSYAYPYPSDYSSYSGYGNGYENYSYGYGSSGYDYGYVSPPLRYYDYANDDESAVRNVLAEYEVSWNGHDTAGLGRLFTEDCDYVNIDGVHWKGVQEIVQRHRELFQKRLKTAVRKLTGVEVRFSTPDVALVDATWNVTGSGRPAGKAVPVPKEITTMAMAKTNGKWLITSFQNTQSGD
jgi:uncharacterized protein (TIGR02246 family)